MEKIYAFIDSQNLNLGVTSLGWRLDFKKFRIFLSEKYKVQKAYLFIGEISGNEKLYKFLKSAGFILIFKPTIEFHKNKIKGNVDAELVLHTMINYNKFDKAIIVSGDGDFYCLVDYLMKNNKLARLIVPNKKYSSLLRRFAKKIIRVEQFKEKVRR